MLQFFSMLSLWIQCSFHLTAHLSQEAIIQKLTGRVASGYCLGQGNSRHSWVLFYLLWYEKDMPLSPSLPYFQMVVFTESTQSSIWNRWALRMFGMEKFVQWIWACTIDDWIQWYMSYLSQCLAHRRCPIRTSGPSGKGRSHSDESPVHKAWQRLTSARAKVLLAEKCFSETFPIFSCNQNSLQPPWGSNMFSSVTQSCPTLYDPMNRSTPGLRVHHQLL